MPLQKVSWVLLCKYRQLDRSLFVFSRLHILWASIRRHARCVFIQTLTLKGPASQGCPRQQFEDCSMSLGHLHRQRQCLYLLRAQAEQ